MSAIIHPSLIAASAAYAAAVAAYNKAQTVEESRAREAERARARWDAAKSDMSDAADALAAAQRELFEAAFDHEVHQPAQPIRRAG